MQMSQKTLPSKGLKKNRVYPQLNFSCFEEYNNKYIRLHETQFKKFANELVQKKFFQKKAEGTFDLVFSYKNSTFDINLLDYISGYQKEIVVNDKFFLIALYKQYKDANPPSINFIFISNLVHANKNYIYVVNFSKEIFKFPDSPSLLPNSNHLMLNVQNRDKNHLSCSKNSHQFEPEITQTIYRNIKFINIGKPKENSLFFQISAPLFMVSLSISASRCVKVETQ